MTKTVLVQHQGKKWLIPFADMVAIAAVMGPLEAPNEAIEKAWRFYCACDAYVSSTPASMGNDGINATISEETEGVDYGSAD